MCHVACPQVTLWKWELLRLGADYDAILYSDLDVDLLPLRPMDQIDLARRVADEWSARLPPLIARSRGERGGAAGDALGTATSSTSTAAAGRSELRMLGYADSTTPLNAGVFWVFPPPDERLFIEGIAVLSAPWDPQRGWESSGPPASLVGTGRPRHVHIQQTSWTQIDCGDLDQGLLLYMLHLRSHLGDYMRRDGTHAARHYVRYKDGKPSQRTLAYLSQSYVGPPGCGWDNIKRHAFLAGLSSALGGAGGGAASPTKLSACARRYRRVAHELASHMNASACCAALGEHAPRGHFGHDMVPVW